MSNHPKLLIGAAILVVMALLPLAVYPVLLMKVMCFAIFACAFNLLLGFTGLLSFGHAMFFGGGAYVAGYLMKAHAVPPELAWLAALVAGAVAGGAVGWLAIRRTGIYFSMVTLALAQMAYFYFVTSPLTGGEDGIQSIPRQPVLGFINGADDHILYYVIMAMFVCLWLLIWRIVHSPFGQSLKAIRDNEARAISLGYRASRYKLLAFVISAAIAALAGGMKSYIFQLASLTDVGWHMSGEVVLMALIGGIGTLTGPVVGAAFLILLSDALASYGEWVVVIQGAIFVAVVLLFRKGLVGTLSELPGLITRLRRPKAKSAEKLNKDKIITE
ncbi:MULTISPECIES: branched-chain amino acid ABC transporter permease [Salipiger]|uniref:Amino acid/amide ABC transporter membrane protein 2, HAAT family n=1 Tax=Salipiger profundus TaxID=1229727 RepID=A0A1U7DDI4_9RHOB|nr:MULTISPECIES: branched-chain amino acid ABC transporter permease [Salipiger]APX26172.1 amino acid/amide ABC transporter membrane protein 2, HAAT family [Salipiger profundus]GGA23588.1 branched-chain amino acid ABC transporter permease [Salipiger profundus]